MRRFNRFGMNTDNDIQVPSLLDPKEGDKEQPKKTKKKRKQAMVEQRDYDPNKVKQSLIEKSLKTVLGDDFFPEAKLVPVGKLNPADYNPRFKLKPGMDAYARLKKSLERWGLVQPLVWNKRTGNVVGGNQRLGVIKREFPATKGIMCTVVNMSIEEEKALNVALNNPSLSSDWDLTLLPDVMLSLSTDLQELSGFTTTDLEDMLGMSERADVFGERGASTSPLEHVTRKRAIVECPQCGHRFKAYSTAEKTKMEKKAKKLGITVAELEARKG